MEMRLSVGIYLVLSSFILILTPFGQAAAQGQQEENVCLTCHKELGGKLAEPVEKWKNSIHKKAEVACADCHGGDPKSFERAKSPEAGFTAAPKYQDIPAFCAKCHSDVRRMRKYNLRTDQFELYKTSIHGQRLLQKGDKKVANCVSCHGSHDTLGKDDPLSPVYRLNVPDTCSKCHSNASLMAEYKIPTNQMELYKKSYHGQLFIEKKDMRVPNCADCHGIHGATPPGVEEVPKVCGNCHRVTASYYEKSPHWLAVKEVGIPRCIDCHGNHNIPFPTTAYFVGQEQGRCGSCHAPDSPPYQRGLKMKSLFDKAESALSKATNNLEEVRRKGGYNVAAQLEGLKEARSKIIEAGPVSHALVVKDVEVNITKADALAAEVIKGAENMALDLKSRRQALVGSLSFLALLIGLLVAKRVAVGREHHRDDA